MRLSRSKIRNEYFGKKFLTIILFLIILPILSIFPGYLAAKYFVIPHFSSGNSSNYENEIQSKNIEQNITSEVEEVSQIKNQNPQETASGSIEFTGFDIFSVQVGNFSTKENANALIEELDQRNMGAYLYESDGFKVITLSLLERSQVDATIPAILNIYEGAFVVPIKISPKTLEYSQDEKQYLELLKIQNERTNQILKIYSDYLFQFKNNLISKETYINNISQVKDSFLLVKENLSSIEPSARLLPLHQEYVGLIAEIIEATNKIDATNGEKLIGHSATTLTKGLFRLMKIYTHF